MRIVIIIVCIVANRCEWSLFLLLSPVGFFVPFSFTASLFYDKYQ